MNVVLLPNGTTGLWRKIEAHGSFVWAGDCLMVVNLALGGHPSHRETSGLGSVGGLRFEGDRGGCEWLGQLLDNARASHFCLWSCSLTGNKGVYTLVGERLFVPLVMTQGDHLHCSRRDAVEGETGSSAGEQQLHEQIVDEPFGR